MNQTALDFDAPAKPTAKGKVTFSRMESISDIPGDTGSQNILLDGRVIGEIIRNMVDTGFTFTEYRVGDYEIVFFDVDSHDRTFTVSRRRCLGVPAGYKTAREAHTAAKNYARAVACQVAK